MLVIVPAVPVPMAAFGRSNCGVLKRLKHSTRNCSRVPSLIPNSVAVPFFESRAVSIDELPPYARLPE
jgi:hypothetical protein